MRESEQLPGSGLPKPSLPATSRAPRLGVLGLGVLLVIGNVYWMRVSAESIGPASHGLTMYALFPNVLGLLFLVVLFNRSAARRFPRWALRSDELIVLYVMLAVATSVCAFDFLYYLPPILASGKWWAAHNPRFTEIFPNAFPSHLVVGDWESVRGYLAGQSSIYQVGRLRPWLTPVLLWLLFLGVLFLATLCLNRLLLPRWAFEERLAFPLASPPLMLTEAQGRLLNDRYFWLALAGSLGLDVIGVLRKFWPAIPNLALVWDLTPTLGHSLPWSAQRFLQMGVTPFVFGLSFLAPRDLCLSLWLFNLLERAAAVVGAQFGLTQTGGQGFPYYSEHALGGCVALVISILWLSRDHLKRIILQAAGARRGDAQEAHAIRLSMAGLAGAGLVLMAFGRLVGLSLWVTLAILCLFFFLAVGTSRVRIQLGPPSIELNWAFTLIPQMAGSQRLSRIELGTITLLSPLNASTRSTPVGLQMEGLYLFSRARVRGQGRILLFSALLGAVASIWAALDVGYRIGIGSAHASTWATRHVVYAFQYLSTWIGNPQPPDLTVVKAFSAGAIITAILTVAVARWPNWPLHPVGFVLSGAFAIHWMLPGIFAAWLTKTLIMRYWGLKPYRRALNVCVGLIIGGSLGYVLSVIVEQFHGLQ